MGRVTVLGATGGIGRAVTLELAARGHEVTAVNRSGSAEERERVRPLAADLDDRDAAIAACARAEVVVMAAQVPYREWTTRFGTLVEHALEAARSADARFVQVDNLYAYGSPGRPITEATPEATTTRKGTARRDVARWLLAAHGEDRARVVIGRLSDYYGPGGTNTAQHEMGIVPALRGKAVRALVDADQPHTFNYLPDVGRAFASLVERPEADGTAWILPAAPPITQREFLTLVLKELDRAPRIGRVTLTMLTLAGLFDARVRQLRELTEQWDRPFTTDASAFQTTLGPIEVTPHERAVPETVAWFRRARAT